ncbi:type IV secretion system DNA-binding domain-containing protein [Kitasatospora sp. NPDC092039]|uniref:type IV secretion system DNA-binding domain-containing protein n=1 Tax=Kitasatospora sp. NPDC092039 TaxID=3364086 RepID=UPI0037FF6FC4
MGTDVVLGYTKDESKSPIHLRYDRRDRHLCILGKSGSGKTVLLEHLVLADMRDGTAAIVIDAQGDLTKRLVSLAPSYARDKIVLVEPNTERPFGLNLYELPSSEDQGSWELAVEHVMEVFNKLMGSEEGYRSVIDPGLRNTARLLIANGLTMQELRLLYRDATFRQCALRQVSNEAREYWREYEALSARDQLSKRDPILNKVERFLGDDRIRLMVSQPTTLPIKQVMDEGGILLLNLARLGDSTTSLLGMVLLVEIERLFHQREPTPRAKRKRVHLYLDEYARFATPITQRMLSECRQFGLGATIAHQNLSQTPQKEGLNVESLIAFQVSGSDAREVAANLDSTPVRTETDVQRRMESHFDEWDEQVWDSQDACNCYEALAARKMSLMKDREKIERRKAVALHAEVYHACQEELAEIDTRSQALTIEMEELYASHHSVVHHKEYLGEVAAQSLDGSSWYDSVEKIRQTHADREAEITNSLTHLVTGVAYCKVVGFDGSAHENIVQMLPPAQASSEEELRESATRISEKLRGLDPEYLLREGFGSWAPEPKYYFKQQGFQDAMRGLIGSMEAPTPEDILQRVRERSRERFGTPRNQVEAQIRQRQERLVGTQPQRPESDHQPAAPHPEADEPQQQARAEESSTPVQDSPQVPPAIGRRSPKKR